MLRRMWGSGRIAGRSALEHTTSHLRVQAQECWVVLQVAATDHLIGKKQQMRPSNNWREAPVNKPRSPWRTLTPLFSLNHYMGQEPVRTQAMEEVSAMLLCQLPDQGGHSRNWFAGILPCLQGKFNHGCEDGGQPFRGTLTSWRNGPKEFHKVPQKGT